MLPLYTGKLPPEQFGLYDLAVTVISLSVPVVFFQIWDGMFRYTFEKQEKGEKYRIVSNSFFVWAAGFLIYSAAFLICKAFWPGLSWFIFLYGISVAIQYQYTFIARAFLKNRLFVASGLLNSILNAIANIVLILVFHIGMESLYIASILGCTAQVLMIEMKLRPLRHFHLNGIYLKEIKEMLYFSMPMCMATILYWLLSGYTKVAISQQLGTYSNGLYAVANRFTSMLMFIIAVFQYAWNEMAYLMAREENRTEKYKKSLEYILKVVLLGCAIFMLLTKIIFPFFVDPSYDDALMLVPLSLTGVAANALAGFIDTIFLAEKKTRWTFRTTILGAGLNIAGLWIFTPIWGLQGAIGALCLAFMALAVFRIIVLSRVFNIKLYGSDSIYIFLLAAGVGMFYLVNQLQWLVVVILLLCGISVISLRGLIVPLCRGLVKKRKP